MKEQGAVGGGGGMQGMHKIPALSQLFNTPPPGPPSANTAAICLHHHPPNNSQQLQLYWRRKSNKTQKYLEDKRFLRVRAWSFGSVHPVEQTTNVSGGGETPSQPNQTLSQLFTKSRGWCWWCV